MSEGNKNKINISDVSGDVVVSKDQSGGITAHTVNINNLEIPEPKIYIKQLSSNIDTSNGYQSEFILSIDSKVVLSNLYIQANANNIIGMDIAPQYNTMLMSGHSGKREEYVFDNIQNAYGDYKITIFTKEIQKIEFDFSY